MVSNLPYNVATPVVVARARDRADDRALPRDGAARGRRAARGGRRHEGVRRGVGEGRVLRRRAKVVGSVPPSVFVPKPKVDSALVQLVRRAQPPVVGARCRAAVRAGARRLRDPPQDAAPRARGSSVDAERRSLVAGIDPTARAETLDARRLGPARPRPWRDPRSTRTRSSRCRCASSAAAPTATTSSTRSMVSVTEPHDALDIEPASRHVADRRRAVRRGRARRRLEPRVARARRDAARRVADRAAQGHPDRRRARRRIGRRGRGARARFGADAARSRRRSVPTCRSACTAAPRGCAASATSLEPVDQPADARRDRDAAVRLLDRRRLPGVGRARRARTTAPQRPRSRRRTPSNRGSPRSGARSRTRSRRARVLAGSGSSYAVVFDDASRSSARTASRRGDRIDRS